MRLAKVVSSEFVQSWRDAKGYGCPIGWIEAKVTWLFGWIVGTAATLLIAFSLGWIGLTILSAALRWIIGTF